MKLFIYSVFISELEFQFVKSNIYISCEKLARVGIRQMDTKKAFPSTQWALVEFLMAKVGVAPSRFWSALKWVHRSSIYKLGEGKFQLSQGFKEGGCSSPPFYIIVYSFVFMAFQRLREAKGLSMGVRLINHPDLTPRSRDEDLGPKKANNMSQERRRRV